MCTARGGGNGEHWRDPPQLPPQPRRDSPAAPVTYPCVESAAPALAVLTSVEVMLDSRNYAGIIKKQWPSSFHHGFSSEGHS